MRAEIDSIEHTLQIALHNIRPIREHLAHFKTIENLTEVENLFLVDYKFRRLIILIAKFQINNFVILEILCCRLFLKFPVEDKSTKMSIMVLQQHNVALFH